MGRFTNKAAEDEVPVSTQMLVALAATGKHIYPGTVPGHVKAHRRAVNKRARAARRAHRKAAR